MCCKRSHINFSTFSLKFKRKICVQKKLIHNFKNHLLVTWPTTNLLILRKWCRNEKKIAIILFKTWPTNRFLKKKNHNFHFHKNDVTWPLIANGLFETDALTRASFQPFIWWRYMDDIFMIWTRSVQDLNTFTSFLNLLNDIHPTMKFTCDYSFTPIPFLDVSVSLHNGKIVTVLYTKPTDKHQYLLNKENIK